MQLDVSQVIKALDGTSFKETEDKDLTLKAVAVSFLLSIGEEKMLSGGEKIERNKIAEKIYGADPVVELSLSEVGKVRNLLDAKSAYPVRVVAEALKMLELAAK